MLDFKDSAADDLERFSQSFFDLDKNLTVATELKYITEIKRILAAQFAQPSEELVKFFTGHVYSGRFAPSVKQQFTGFVKKALQQFLSDRINERLKSALAEPQPQPAIQSKIQKSAVVKNENGKVQTNLNFSALELKGKKPRAVVIMGESYAVSTWRDVMQTTLNTLIDKDVQLFDKMIEKFPKYVALENKFRSSRQLSNGAFIETNMAARSIYKFCRDVIKFSSLSDGDWLVELIE